METYSEKLMKTQHHALLAIPFLLLISYLDWSLILFFFVENILIDSDHIINFWLSMGKLDFNFRRIYKLSSDRYGEHWSSMRFYFPFHSLELIILIPIITLLVGMSYTGVAISLGMIYHFVFDIITMAPFFKCDYRKTTLFYFFLYRWHNDFSPNMYPTGAWKNHIQDEKN